MKRETVSETLEALHDQIHEMANVMNTLSLRVDVLWAEYKQQRQKSCQKEKQP